MLHTTEITSGSVIEAGRELSSMFGIVESDVVRLESGWNPGWSGGCLWFGFFSLGAGRNCWNCFCVAKGFLFDFPGIIVSFWCGEVLEDNLNFIIFVIGGLRDFDCR